MQNRKVQAFVEVDTKNKCIKLIIKPLKCSCPENRMKYDYRLLPTVRIAEFGLSQRLAGPKQPDAAIELAGHDALRAERTAGSRCPPSP